MATYDPPTWSGQGTAFGPFRLHPEQRVLYRADTPVRLGSRALEILLILVERAGEMGRRTAVSRHQTLRATLDWSYEILSRLEQIALRRLAVFAGTFDMRSASAVIADDEVPSADVPVVLTNLAAKSLLITQLAGEQIFYRLFDTSRAYALEKLEDSHESAEIKRRHARLCCSWGEDQLDWEPLEWTAGKGQRIDDARGEALRHRE